MDIDSDELLNKTTTTAIPSTSPTFLLKTTDAVCDDNRTDMELNTGIDLPGAHVRPVILSPADLSLPEMTDPSVSLLHPTMTPKPTLADPFIDDNNHQSESADKKATDTDEPSEFPQSGSCTQRCDDDANIPPTSSDDALPNFTNRFV